MLKYFINSVSVFLSSLTFKCLNFLTAISFPLFAISFFSSFKDDFIFAFALAVEAHFAALAAVSTLAALSAVSLFGAFAVDSSPAADSANISAK